MEINLPITCTHLAGYLILVLFPLSVICQDPQWIIPPSDTQNVEGSSVQLQCRVSDRNGRSVAWIRYQDGVAQNLFTGNEQWINDDRFSVQEFDDGFDLTIAGLQRSDNGQYQCDIARTTLKATAQVTVLGRFDQIWDSII